MERRCRMQIDRDWQFAEIVRTLRIFRRGEVCEIRIPKIGGRGKPYTAVGYFRDYEAAAEAVANFDRNRVFAGIYFVLNPIHPALWARSPEMLTEFAESTATDTDVTRRDWMMVDLDPVRPSGVSSSDEEFEEACRRADDVYDHMRDALFPDCIVADSGNGRHLIYPISMANDATSLSLVSGILKDLQARYGKDAADYEGRVPIDIDVSVCNAARICKLYGTVGRKGHDVSERPHRVAKLVYVPDCLEVLT